MRRFLKALPVALLLLALAAVSIFAVSCGSSSVQARFVNAVYNTSSYGGGLDVEVNGVKDFTAIAFPTASGSTYKGLPAGNDTFLGLQENTTTQVFQDPATLSGGTQYTLVAAGQAQGNGTSTVSFKPFGDNNTAPAAGNVNFRIINASDAESAVDVYIEQTPFTGTIGQNGVTAQVTNLAYMSASGYVTLPWNSNAGGGWTIYVTPAGSTLIILNGFNTGNFGGTGTESIRTLILTDDANTNNSISSVPIVLDDLN
jgi:hypothetical protein